MAKISIREAYNFNFSVNEQEKKELLVLKWLVAFREYLLKNKIANYGDIMPNKKDISKYLKVSTGTIQNALKYAEDKGLFTSKQCIGTLIKDENEKAPTKMFSKKDRAAIEIKKYLFNQKYDENEIIPSVAELAGELKTSTNTIRLAINELVETGFLRKEQYKNKIIVAINRQLKLTEKEKSLGGEIKNKNLVKITKENMKKYIQKNYKTGDKIPPNSFFVKMFNVSIRTVNAAAKELNKEKFVLSRRGKYGSIYINANLKETKSEKSMFMSKVKGENEIKPNYDYKWEYALNNIKNYILKNHEAGDKIPSMKEFSQKLNLSVSTVKKAVHQLISQGILFAQKGKYGGLFIVEMPQREDSYTWLAINPSYFNEN